MLLKIREVLPYRLATTLMTLLAILITSAKSSSLDDLIFPISPDGSSQKKVSIFSGDKAIYSYGVKTGNLPITKISKYQSCLLNPLAFPGQGWNAGFTDGGLAENSTKLGKLAQAPELAMLFGFPASKTPNQISGGSNKANILVIDFFKPIKAEIFNFGNDSIINMSISHGGLVLYHLKSIVNKFNNSKISVSTLPLMDDNNDEIITSEEFYSSLKQNGVQEKLKSAAVINMSFVILPCRIAINYKILKSAFEKQSGGKRFGVSDYIRSLKILNPNVSSIEIEKAISDIPDFDNSSFASFIENRGKTVLVSASGNYNMTVSLYPGRLNNVISVGAKEWVTGGSTMPKSGKAVWSNAADVYAVGEWFKYPGDFQGISDFGYLGTSFSAPAVSAIIAARLSNDLQCLSNLPTHYDFPTGDFWGTAIMQTCKR